MSRLIKFIFAGLLFGLSMQFYAQNVHESDSLALVALFNETSGNSWVKADNWLEGPLDTWYGIVCENDRVTAINLSANNLVGSLPSELYSLTALQYLYISFNGLEGSLDGTIRNLNQLQVLWASNNMISGTLPDGIGGLDSLKTLYLNNNQFSGTIPDSIGFPDKLENINLSYNAFGGSLPTSLGALLNLKYLTLNNNKLKDSVPDGLTAMVKLRSLKLDNNYFTYLPDLTGIPGLDNTSGNSVFTIHANLLDFTDIERNLSVMGNQSNYYPQRTFQLVTLIDAHPGDSLFMNMPAMAKIDTSDVKNSYRYVLDSKEVQAYSSNSDYRVSDASRIDVGSYVCYIKHESFPDLYLTVSRVRFLPPAGKSWMSLGVKYNDELQDTIDYDIVALKNIEGVYSPEMVSDTKMDLRREFLIPYGTYLFYLVPKGNDTTLFSRYHKNSLLWQNNQESVLRNRRDYAFNVTMLDKVYSEGTGSVSGKVSEVDAASTDEGGVLVAKEGIMVMLYSESEDKWYKQCVSDVIGAYAFDNLPDGLYAVYIDYPGYMQNEVRTIELTSENQDIEDINFTLYMQDNVVLDIEKAEATVTDLNSIAVYVERTGHVNINLSNPANAEIDVNIFDLSGKRIFTGSAYKDSRIALPLQLNKGIYIIQLRSKHMKTAKKFIVK